MLSQEKNPTTWWGFLILPSVPFFPPRSQIAVSSCSRFSPPHKSLSSPTCVTLGVPTLPLYFKTKEGSVPRGTERGRLLRAAFCAAWLTLTGPPLPPHTVCTTTLAGLFTAEALFRGGGRGGGRKAGRQGRKEGVYYPQESRNSSWAIPPFGWQLWKQLPGIYSLCVQMESQLWVSFESSKWWRKWWACDLLHSEYISVLYRRLVFDVGQTV